MHYSIHTGSDKEKTLLSGFEREWDELTGDEPAKGRNVPVPRVRVLVRFPEHNMESAEDVEDGTTEENILYDLTIQAEWPQEPEIFVRHI